jgi:hypothetical protein
LAADDLSGFVTSERTNQLGRVAVNFQHVEMSLAFLTWALIPVPQDRRAIITSQLPFDRLLTVFYLLLKGHIAHNASHVAELDEISKKASELEQNRNTLMHSVWAAGEAGEVTRMKWAASRKKGLSVQSPETTAADIQKVADDLRDLSKRLMGFTERLRKKGLINYQTAPGPR